MANVGTHRRAVGTAAGTAVAAAAAGRSRRADLREIAMYDCCARTSRAHDRPLVLVGAQGHMAGVGRISEVWTRRGWADGMLSLEESRFHA